MRRRVESFVQSSRRRRWRHRLDFEICDTPSLPFTRTSSPDALYNGGRWTMTLLMAWSTGVRMCRWGRATTIIISIASFVQNEKNGVEKEKNEKCEIKYRISFSMYGWKASKLLYIVYSIERIFILVNCKCKKKKKKIWQVQKRAQSKVSETTGLWVERAT